VEWICCESVPGGRHPPRHKRLVVVGGLCQRQALEQPGQVTVWIDTIGLASFNETKEICAGMCAGNRICEQEALARNDHCPFILPISGRTWKSIIVGTHCMGGESRFETLNNEVATAWSMLKRVLV